MRIFVRIAIKGGRCYAFNQHYKSENSDEVFNIISEEANINVNVCDLLEKCFKILNKYGKQYTKEFDSKYVDNKDIDREIKTDFINKKHNMLAIYKELSKLKSNKTQMDHDATSFYPSAMWDENSVYPKIESGFAFKPNMNDIYVEAFNHKFFNQDGNDSGILTISIPVHLILFFNIYQLKRKLKRSKLIE